MFLFCLFLIRRQVPPSRSWRSGWWKIIRTQRLLFFFPVSSLCLFSVFFLCFVRRANALITFRLSYARRREKVYFGCFIGERKKFLSAVESINCVIKETTRGARAGGTTTGGSLNGSRRRTLKIRVSHPATTVHQHFHSHFSRCELWLFTRSALRLSRCVDVFPSSHKKRIQNHLSFSASRVFNETEKKKSFRNSPPPFSRFMNFYTRRRPGSDKKR